MTDTSQQNALPFWRRFLIYQKERFPFLGHGTLVAAFSFSAIAYSRICRGAEGFVDTGIYLTGIFTTISLFFLVRIFDEFKDAEEDALYRKQLPVPRGLIKFSELKTMGIITFILQILVNAIFFPKMLWMFFVVIAYLCLMGKEFFIAEWLKKHPFWYVTSHMMIIPLIDIYASGLDWNLSNEMPHQGLLFFFAVSFMNGIVLEVGRKIRTPEKEEHNTYSTMMGMQKATQLWLGMITITALLAAAASWYAGYGQSGLIVLSAIVVVCIIPGILFLFHKTAKLAKFIEYASALWTIGMYFSLGAIPMITKLVNG